MEQYLVYPLFCLNYELEEIHISVGSWANLHTTHFTTEVVPHCK